MSQLRVGVVGTGSIARARHIPMYQQHEHAELVALCDVAQPAVEATAAQFDIPDRYTDHREMFSEAGLDAISICTPNKFHAQVAQDALRTGIHVLCEKPMATSAAEGRAMVTAARESGKILQIGYRYRFQAQPQAAKMLIDAGELGEVYMVRVDALRRRNVPSWGTFLNKEIQGGGALVDFGVHLIDLALWLAGHPKVEEVSGVASNRLGKRGGVNEWGPWDPQKFEVEDHAAALLRLEGGKAMQVEVSWALNVPSSLENVSLSGTEGGLEVFPLALNKEGHGMLLDVTPAWIPDAKRSDWDGQLDDFISSILEGREPLVKPEQALQVSEIVDAIYESSATGAAVKLG